MALLFARFSDMWGVMNGEGMQQAHRDYLESQILSARPPERVYLLYKVAQDSVRGAIQGLRNGDIFARGKAINKAHEAVDELNFALDHSLGATFTSRLSELYVYIQRQLVKGHSQKSEAALQEALSVLTTLADTWKEVVVRTCGASSTFLDQQPAKPVEAPEQEDIARPADAPRSVTAYAGLPMGSENSRDWSG